jgi:hypothetical protein
MAEVLLKYLTFMEQHHEVDEWVRSRWPDAFEKNSVPRAELDSEIQAYFGNRTEEDRRRDHETLQAKVKLKLNPKGEREVVA